MSDQGYPAESKAASTRGLAAAGPRLALVGVGAVLMIAGSLLPWMSFGHIGDLQVVVDQSGVDLGSGYVTLACGIGLALLVVRPTRRTATIPIGAVGSLAGAGLVTLAATAALLMLRPAGTYEDYGPAWLDLAFFGTGIGALTAAAGALKLPARYSLSATEDALVVITWVGSVLLLVGAFTHALLANEPIDRQGMVGTVVVALAMTLALVLLILQLRAMTRQGVRRALWGQRHAD